MQTELVGVISIILTIMVIAMFGYQMFYILVALVDEIKTRIQKNNRYKAILNGTAKAEDFIEKDGEPHKFGFIIAARNEENVIANLIESIKEQNYPGELIDIFVVADNCTDNTASVAKDAGAVVYERFNDKQVGKSYALDFVFNKIKDDYGSYRAYDGYFIFDADNIVGKNFTRAMNNEFCKGYRVVTGYRNSKNFDTNWITAGYSIAFMREAKYLNNSRKLLKSSAMVSGTGYMVSSEIIEENNGWHFNLMTEDIQLSAHLISNDEKIGYAKDAMFYDEQPSSFMQSWHQRLRWTKGFYQVQWHYGYKLFKRFFTKPSMMLSKYDAFMTLAPSTIFTLISAALTIISVALNIKDVEMAMSMAPETFMAMGTGVIQFYLITFIWGLFTIITEWDKIVAPNGKKILYLFTYPLFMFTYVPMAFFALFTKVTWKPIKHTVSKTASDFNNEKAEFVK
ncbi:MAG: glycosyltransferase family 2 protein [Lachnospiraceae bacterium]|nr:glycosyltransferase [Lachnospiraceae bacterium]MDY2956366.1 glycosyltransferase family 2 protein [Lachnospiraceae bacterium]